MPRILLPSLALLGALMAPTPAPGLDLDRKYEEDLVRWALEQQGLKLEPDPRGRTVERVVIARENIVAPTDPWPMFVNYFHVKTRPYVIRQELLIGRGDAWQPELVEESARNLRKLFILAVVRIVPCKAMDPDKVILLVVTKDLWSIRLNMIFSLVGPVLEHFEAFPTEANFLGRNKRISLHVRLSEVDVNQLGSQIGRSLLPSHGALIDDPDVEGSAVYDHFALGQIYLDNRLLGSRLRLLEWLDLVFSGNVPCGGATGGSDGAWCSPRGTGDIEGAYALLQLERPLFALSTRWGFNVFGSVDVRQVRRYVFNADGSDVPRGQTSRISLRTDTFAGHPDFPEGSEPVVPRVYDVRNARGQASLTRSFGRSIKHDVTSGVGLYVRRYSHPDDFPFDALTLRWHARNFLPRSEDAGYFFVSYRTRDTRYVRLRNIQGFALSEDFALGHDASLTTRFATNLREATQGFVEAELTARYRWYARQDLLTLQLLAATRVQPRLEDTGHDGPFGDSRLELQANNVSPPLWIGRLHLRARLILRDNDLDNQRLFLGGGSGLRGYLSEQFEGDDLLQVNLEYRTRPLNLRTVHFGLVAFYDGGSVFGGIERGDEDTSFRYHHSAGLGLRVQFPQFDKESLRVDFAVPLSAARPPASSWLSLSFQQVF